MTARRSGLGILVASCAVATGAVIAFAVAVTCRAVNRAVESAWTNGD